MATPITVQIRWASNVADLKAQIAGGTGSIVAMKTAVDKTATALGGEGLLRAAHNTTAAIQQLGGATALTAGEQAKIHTLLTKAIEKYQALGKEAPAAMVQLRDATKAADTPTQSWTASLLNLTNMVRGFMALQVVQFIKGMVSSGMEWASTLVNLHAKTDLAYRDLQILEDIGIDTGVSMDTLAKTVQVLQERIGNGTARRGIQDLGLSFDQLRNASPAEQLSAIGAAVAKIEDPTERAKVAAEIFGKTWREVLPALRTSMADAARGAKIVGDASIEAADRAGDRWAKFWNDQKRGWAGWAGNTLLNFENVAKKKAELDKKLYGPVDLPKSPNPNIGGGPWEFAAPDPEMISRLKVYGMTLDEAARASERSAKSTSEHATGVSQLVSRLGGQEAIQAAKLWIDALPKIGGLTRIAKQDQVELHGVLLTALEAYKRMGVEPPQAMRDLAAASVPVIQATRTIGQVVSGPGGLAQNFTDLSENVLPSYGGLLFSVTERTDAFGRVTATQAVPSVKGLSGVISEIAPKVGTLTQAFTTLPETIFKAFTGGGGIKGALNAFASQIGSGLFGEDGAFSGVMKSAQGALTKTFGTTVGGAMSAAIPGIGAMIGPAFEALARWIGSLFGNKTKDAIVQSFGTYDALREKLNALGDEGERMWIRLTQQTGRNDLASTKAQIEEINKALGFQREAMQTLDETAKKYNITIEEMGPAWQKQELEKKALELYKDYQVLIAAGIDHGLVIEKMAGGINEYVKNALRMGAEVPEAMRPMLEEMAKSGELLDVNGEKVLDLKDSGIVFAMTMSEGFRTLISEVQKLTDAIARGLGLSLQNIPHPRAPWADWEPPPELPDYGDSNDGSNAGSVGPGFAGGTHGQYVDFGAGTRVTLHRRERVMTEAEGRSESADLSQLVQEMRAGQAQQARQLEEALMRVFTYGPAYARAR